MKYKKFNKFEKKEVRRAIIAEALAGGGKYLYQNSSKVAELTLPRPTASGLRKVPADGKFQGDDYYMQMVKSGDLRLIEVMQTAEQEVAAKNEETRLLTEATASNVKGGVMTEQKLIVEQPEKVTSKGTVEHVVEGTTPPKKKKPLRETEEKKVQPDILLNESLGDDGFVIVG